MAVLRREERDQLCLGFTDLDLDMRPGRPERGASPLKTLGKPEGPSADVGQPMNGKPCAGGHPRTSSDPRVPARLVVVLPEQGRATDQVVTEAESAVDSRPRRHRPMVAAVLHSQPDPCARQPCAAAHKL